MPDNVTSLCPLVQVFNMPEALLFYCDGLGFEVVSHSEEIDAPEGRYFYWAWLRLGSANLMLNAAYEEGERPPRRDETRQRAHDDTALYLNCRELDAIFADLKARGLATEPPKTAPYGMRQLYLRDPDGYTVCFQQTV